MLIIDWIIKIFCEKYWIYPAILISSFWGWRAVSYSEKYNYKIKESSSGQINIFRDGKYFSVGKCHHFFVNRVYEFIFHFVGSVSGWICLVILVNIRGDFYKTSNGIILFILALLGVTGHLPQALYGFVRSIGILTEKIVNKVSK